MFDHVAAFHQPHDVREAIRLLRTGKGGTRVLAGGTDLVVEADRSTRALIDITRLGLHYIRPSGGGLRIGSSATMAALEESAAIRRTADGILAAAASTCGSVQNRNMATVGGNLANASPAADLAPPLLALDAVVVLAAARGRRRVSLAEFYRGPGKTVLNGALLVEVQVPGVKPSAHWSFQKLGRGESDIALVNAAAGLAVDRTGRVSFVRIAVGAVAPTPMRARKAEALMLGQKLSRKLVERAGESVSREVRPLTDQRASAEYRRDMARVLVLRALGECALRGGWPL